MSNISESTPPRVPIPSLAWNIAPPSPSQPPRPNQGINISPAVWICLGITIVTIIGLCVAWVLRPNSCIRRKSLKRGLRKLKNRFRPEPVNTIPLTNTRVITDRSFAPKSSLGPLGKNGHGAPSGSRSTVRDGVDFGAVRKYDNDAALRPTIMIKPFPDEAQEVGLGKVIEILEVGRGDVRSVEVGRHPPSAEAPVKLPAESPAELPHKSPRESPRESSRGSLPLCPSLSPFQVPELLSFYSEEPREPPRESLRGSLPLCPSLSPFQAPELLPSYSEEPRESPPLQGFQVFEVQRGDILSVDLGRRRSYNVTPRNSNYLSPKSRPISLHLKATN